MLKETREIKTYKECYNSRGSKIKKIEVSGNLRQGELEKQNE